jgi:hypothetical protein
MIGQKYLHKPFGLPSVEFVINLNGLFIENKNAKRHFIRHWNEVSFIFVRWVIVVANEIITNSVFTFCADNNKTVFCKQVVYTSFFFFL